MNTLETSHLTATRWFGMSPRALIAITVLSGLLTWWLYAVGDQPVVYDADGYLRRAVTITQVGLLDYAVDGYGGNRLYGYPWFVSLVVSVVGTDPYTAQRAVMVVQWLLFVPTMAITSWAVARALGRPDAAVILYGAALLNPILLIGIGNLLTDFLSALLVWCATIAAFVEFGRRRMLAPSLSLAVAAFATVVRPANLAVLVALAGIWAARAILRRDVTAAALAVGVVAGAAVFVPQVIANYRAYEKAHPLLAENDLYARQSGLGVRRLKYGTVVIDGVEPQLRYENPLIGDPDYTLPEFLAADPGATLLTFAIHAFTFVDQDFPYTYIRDLDPWYRQPLAVLNFGFLLLALWGHARGLLFRDAPLWPMLVLLVVGGAYFAVYLPTTIENRFSMPVYLLALPGFALGLQDARCRWQRRSPTLAVGAAVMGLLIVGGLLLSEWVRWQAPTLRALTGA